MRPLVEWGHPEISVRRQCELLGVNRSGLYYEPVGESEENLLLMRLVDEQYTRAPFYGSRKMMVWLATVGYEVNRKRVSRLMAYGPKTQFLPFSAISGIEWRLYEASYATGRPWPNSLWRRSRIRRSTQLGRSFRIFRIVKLGVLGFRCVRRFFRQWPANSCSATFIAENSTAQAAAR